MKRRIFKRVTVGVIGLAIAGAAVFFLLPVQLGGGTSYSIILGKSMEPRLHRGDLAVLRARSDYRVGDVVAYRSEELRRVVLHRILRRDEDRYVFKGDNNGYTDPMRPDREDLVGELVVAVPRVGLALEWLRVPLNAALVAGGLVFLFAGGGAGIRRRRRRRETNVRGRKLALPSLPSLPSLPALPALPQLERERVAAVLTALAVAAVAFVALGIVVFSADSSRTSATAGVRHTGSFHYSARAKRGPVYPSGRVAPGDTVFLRLVRSVAVGFVYRLEGPDAAAARGTAGLRLELTGDNGWRRSIVLRPARAFKGATVGLLARLDLQRLRTLVAEVEAATGTRSASYAADLVPTINVAAHGKFEPRLAFRLDQLQLKPEQPQASLARSQSSGGSAADGGEISIVGLDIPVVAARRIALVGAVLALLGLLAAGLLFRRSRPREEDGVARVAERHREWIVEGRAHRAPHATLVEVATLEELVRVAERYDRLIIHDADDGDAYVLQEDGVLYRFAVAPRPAKKNGRVPVELRARQAAPKKRAKSA